jgi:hypothetical protein
MCERTIDGLPTDFIGNSYLRNSRRANDPGGRKSERLACPISQHVRVPKPSEVSATIRLRVEALPRSEDDERRGRTPVSNVTHSINSLSARNDTSVAPAKCSAVRWAVFLLRSA